MRFNRVCVAKFPNGATRLYKKAKIIALKKKIKLTSAANVRTISITRANANAVITNKSNLHKAKSTALKTAWRPGVAKFARCVVLP